MASETLKTPCDDCPGAVFMGTTSCTAEDDAKYAEKKILKELYYEAGGPDWVEATNWTTPGVGVCNYQGIKCKNGKHDNEGVSEIDLTEYGTVGNYSYFYLEPSSFNVAVGFTQPCKGGL